MFVSLKRDVARYRALDSRAWLLALVRTVNTGGLSLVMVFMGIYMVSSRGLALAEYGLIVMTTSVIQSWAQGFAGMLSDRLGRRPVMAAALTLRTGVICALGALVLADASIALITVVLVASSSLRGAFEPVAYAFVADVVAPADRVAAFGLQRMGTNLGWAIGPALGGALIGLVDYGVVFFCAAPALLVSAAFVLRLREPERTDIDPSEPRRSVVGALVEAVRERAAAIFLFGVFLTAVAHLQLFTTLSVYAEQTLGLAEAEIGRAYTVNATVVLLLQLPAVALIGRIGSRAALIVGAGLVAGGFVLFGRADAFWGVAVGVAVLTLGEILLAPAQQAIVAELSDPSAYGKAFGMMGTVTMLGVAVGPLLGGLAFDHLGADGMSMWLVLAAFPLATLLSFAGFALVSGRPRATKAAAGRSKDC